MRRQRFPYHEWEDCQVGMYNPVGVGRVEDARGLLGRASELEGHMRVAVQRWPRAAAHNLTDRRTNERAWLGWAACCVGVQAPAHITRAAWWQLSEAERAAANRAAARVIREYQGDAKTLFDL